MSGSDLKGQAILLCILSQNISQENKTDIMVLMMNYKYDNPQSLLRVILCQINRFENKPLTEDILYFFYLFKV